MMRVAIQAGMTNHMVSMKGVVKQCKIHLGKPLKTVFYKPFKNIQSKHLKSCISVNLFYNFSWKQKETKNYSK